MKRLDVTIFFTVALMVFLCATPFAMGHGTDHQVIRDRQSVVVAFSYSDGEPMRYAGVLVFSPENDEPENDKIEYQSGRTDKKGFFAFCPNAPGIWRIEAGDGMGHKEKGQIEIRELKIEGSTSFPEIIDTIRPPDLLSNH